MASFSMPRIPEGVIAQPSDPQFSSSQAVICTWRRPKPSGGTAILTRTGKMPWSGLWVLGTLIAIELIIHGAALA
jgi:hypothetical protein